MFKVTLTYNWVKSVIVINISSLVHKTRFWNKIHQVRSNSKELIAE
jgi:hypothetical protein